jgi:hypothetical protein
MRAAPGFGLVALLSANVCRSATNHHSKAGRREDGGKKQGLSDYVANGRLGGKGPKGFVSRTSQDCPGKP